MEKYFAVTPRYHDSILGITGSILKHYGLTPPHGTCSELDSMLSANYKNVVLFVLDGFGSENLKDLLGNDAFLSRHKIKDLSSVFPTTTTAALTSIETGLTPLEHGWLGWQLYFKDKNQNLPLFGHYNEIQKLLPAKTAFKKIKGADFYHLSPFETGRYRAENLKDIAQELPELTKKRGKKFIYCYSNEPDHTLHDYGNFASETKAIVEGINNMFERLRRELDDTLLIITADHGHTDTPIWIDTDKIEGLADTLKFPTPVMEPRAAGFFVKDDKREEFLAIINNAIGDKGIILKKEEAELLFGSGERNKMFDELLGDFVVVMTKDANLWSMRDATPYKSMHAGLSARELNVPLITITCAKISKTI